MPRRWFAFGFASAGLLALGVAVGSHLTAPRTADAAPKAEAKPAAPLRTGHVVLSELMRDYTKWQERATAMNQKRAAAQKELTALQGVIAAGSKQAETATGDDKVRLAGEVVDARRKFEDAERKAREQIDRESADALKELFAEIADAIRQVADERQLDAVYGIPAHPERAIELAKQNMTPAIELLLRPPAMQPLYLRASADLTATLVERLNAKAGGEKK